MRWITLLCVATTLACSGDKTNNKPSRPQGTADLGDVSVDLSIFNSLDDADAAVVTCLGSGVACSGNVTGDSQGSVDLEDDNNHLVAIMLDGELVALTLAMAGHDVEIGHTTTLAAMAFLRLPVLLPDATEQAKLFEALIAEIPGPLVDSLASLITRHGYIKTDEATFAGINDKLDELLEALHLDTPDLGIAVGRDVDEPNCQFADAAVQSTTYTDAGATVRYAIRFRNWNAQYRSIYPMFTDETPLTFEVNRDHIFLPPAPPPIPDVSVQAVIERTADYAEDLGSWDFAGTVTSQAEATVVVPLEDHPENVHFVIKVDNDAKALLGIHWAIKILARLAPADLPKPDELFLIIGEAIASNPAGAEELKNAGQAFMSDRTRTNATKVLTELVSFITEYTKAPIATHLAGHFTGINTKALDKALAPVLGSISLGITVLQAGIAGASAYIAGAIGTCKLTLTLDWPVCTEHTQCVAGWYCDTTQSGCELCSTCEAYTACADRCGLTECNNLCSEDATQCTFGEYRTCEADDNGCRNWSAPQTCDYGCADTTACLERDCPAETDCTDRECGPDPFCGESCGTCDSPPPPYCADDWTLVTPGPSAQCLVGMCEYDEPTQFCDLGCDNATGSCIQCDNLCSEGETSCTDGQLKTCEADVYQCWHWSGETPCTDGFCGDPTSCGACDHKCTDMGSVCNVDGVTLESCTADDDGCRVLSTVTCDLGCVDGACYLPMCQDGTKEGDEHCDSDVVECSTLNPDYVIGLAFCNDSCSAYDLSRCVSHGVPDTGVTECATSTALGLACPQGVFPTQDAESGTNVMNFTDHGNGTLTHDDTGLMWQVVDDQASYTHATATSACDSLVLAGYDDWRLPDRFELFSIVDFGRASPSIDPLFSSTGLEPYWTSTPAVTPSLYWRVDFSTGVVYASADGSSHRVRCVRDPSPPSPCDDTYCLGGGSCMDAGGSPVCACNVGYEEVGLACVESNAVHDPGRAGTGVSYCATGTALNLGCPQTAYPEQDGDLYDTSTDFVDGLDGTIYHAHSGLMWQSVDDQAIHDHSAAIAYCESLQLAGHNDWRLPDRFELHSLVDYGRSSPAIDARYYPRTGTERYWSATRGLIADTFLYVGFTAGLVGQLTGTDEYRVRCVRDAFVRSVCDDVGCSRHGTCVVAGSPPTCACEQDYEEVGLACVSMTSYATPGRAHTGLSWCASATTLHLGCPVSGFPAQDADYYDTSIAFTDNGDGTITHDETGLMWQSEDEQGLYSFVDAVGYCEVIDLGGHVDWRIPDRFELHSIIDYSRPPPMIDPRYFPQTGSEPYWSSTVTVVGGSHWHVKFEAGRVTESTDESMHRVRCVR